MMSEDDWDAVLDTNRKGVFNVTAGGFDNGPAAARVGLNIASISGLVGIWTNQLFGFQSRIDRIHQGACQGGGSAEHRNALALGLIETDMTSTLAEEYRQKMIEQIL
jgi:3-oxoacyl-[acyl-carrier protein] reductase